MLSVIESRLDELIPPPTIPLYQAARYSLLSCGKRFRPLLVINSAKTFGAAIALSLDPASAIEMVHTYSLIHDDLPCMDNDDYRRQKPTLHKAFSEEVALSTGDYLLTYAFEVIAKAPGLSPIQRLRLVQILSAAGGSFGMIGGQAMDIDDKGIDEQNLLWMHRAKTGALIAASLQFGAVIGSAEEKYFPLLEKLGMEIGLAYQLLDDLVDREAAFSLYGKDGIRNKLHELEISIQNLLHELPNGGALIKERLGHHLWNPSNSH